MALRELKRRLAEPLPLLLFAAEGLRGLRWQQTSWHKRMSVAHGPVVMRPP